MKAETTGHSNPPIRILIADDHPVVRNGVRQYFQNSTRHDVVGCVGSMQGTFSVLAETAVDVVILDIQMPGVTGPETIRSLCGDGVDVILFSLMKENAVVTSLIDAGAKGYVSKSEPLDALCKATERVYNQRSAIPSTIANSLQADLIPYEKLPAREKDVFTLLGRRMSPKEIAFELKLSVSTVYSNIERIRIRLHLLSTDELVNHAADWALLEGPSRDL